MMHNIIEGLPGIALDCHIPSSSPVDKLQLNTQFCEFVRLFSERMDVVQAK